MENKIMLEVILWDLKVMADLLLHGSIESATKNVHKTFRQALDDILDMQNDVINTMIENNMYEIKKTSEDEIACTKNKYDIECK